MCRVCSSASGPDDVMDTLVYDGDAAASEFMKVTSASDSCRKDDCIDLVGCSGHGNDGLHQCAAELMAETSNPECPNAIQALPAPAALADAPAAPAAASPAEDELHIQGLRSLKSKGPNSSASRVKRYLEEVRTLVATLWFCNTACSCFFMSGLGYIARSTPSARVIRMLFELDWRLRMLTTPKLRR